MKNLVHFICISLIVISCQNNRITQHPPEKFDRVFGFIHQIENCYVIEIDGKNYYPINLDQKFKEEGIRVKIKAKSVSGKKDKNCKKFPRIELDEIIRYRN